MHHGFARYSSMFVPKLFPSFEVTPSTVTKSLGTVAVSSGTTCQALAAFWQ
jgi:hypothetical protein